MIVALTGHRPNKLGNEYGLKGPYSRKLYKKLLCWLKENKPESIISGMALGCDQIWALCGIKLNIDVIAAIPCVNHESRWPESSKKLYNNILNKKNILLEGSYKATIEESELSYKDVEEVINVTEQAELGKKVAKLKPLAVMIG